MNKSTIHKQTIFAILIFLASLNLSAQDKSQKEYKFNVIPQIDFGMLQLENDTLLYSPSGTLMFKYQKEEAAEINGPDVIACSFSYGQDIFSKYDSEINERDLQLYEIVGKSDALITDYSSISFDYLLVNKPICYVLDDLSLYKSERGFVWPDILQIMPGYHVYEKTGFYKFLIDINLNKDIYAQQREEIKHYVYNNCDDKSCERFEEYFLK